MVRWVALDDDSIGGECRCAYAGSIYDVESAFEHATFALGGFLAEARNRCLTGEDARPWCEFLGWYADRVEEDVDFVRSEIECGMEDEDGLWGDAYDVHQCLLPIENSGQYEGVRECIEALLKYTSDAVDKNWPAIQAVAERLAADHFLYGRDVRDIIAAARA